MISRLDTRPASSPVNASSLPSRAATHDSGSAWLAEPSPSWTFTFLHLAGFDRRTEAHRFLDALGIAARERVIGFRGTETRLSVGVSLLVMLVMLVMTWLWFAFQAGDSSSFARLLLVELMVVSVVSFAVRPTYRVGADGIEIRRVGHHRFIRYADVREATITPEGVTLTLKRGFVHLHAPATGPDGNALCVRVRDALAAYRESAPIRVDVLALSSAQETEAWLATLRGVARSLDTYRSRSIDVDDLSRVLADGAQPPAQRAAAAYVLRVRVPEDAKERVRVACDTTADESLRVALERIAEGEEAEAEEALRSLAKS